MSLYLSFFLFVPLCHCKSFVYIVCSGITANYGTIKAYLTKAYLMIYGNMQFKHGYHERTFVNIRVVWCYHVMLSLYRGQFWGKLLLKVMRYNIALLPKKVANFVS